LGTSHILLTGDSAYTVDSRTGLAITPNAQIANAQGRLAAWNIYAQIRGLPMGKFRPSSLGVVASLGPGKGVGMVKSIKTKGLTTALVKEMVPLRYLYMLGGMRLMAKRLF